MAKPETKKPEVKQAPPLSVHTFRPTRDDSFRLVRSSGNMLWVIQVTRVTNGQHVFTRELDPPDTLDSMERKVAGLVQEAERR